MHCLCRPSRIMSVRINLLDETDFIHEIKDDLPGQALLDVVFARLNLIETSYFGIRYIDEENQTHWLDPASRISRQLKPKADPYDLYFGVKFYAADPCKLVEEITRYQLFLQVKQDVLQGRLPVAFELAAELGAFVVQSELGDYDQRRHSKGYVSEFRLLPNQSSELESRVSELHQQLKGMSPAAAELNYLDKVKWHDMYGVDLHPVLGEDSVEYFLGLTPSGIVVLRNKTTVAHYYWPRIAKVYYKGRYFMLRISDKNNELNTYGFETPRKSACKHLWRCCVEHHAFFRLMRVSPSLPNSPTNTSDIFQLGSRLKCSKEKSSKDSLFINRSPPTFVRVPSKRQPRRIIDDFLNGVKKAEFGSSAFLNTKNASNYESPYRSTYSIPTSLAINPYHHQPSQQQQQQQQHTMPHSQSNYNNNGGNSNGGGGGNANNNHIQTPDSPRSTRSAPWPRTQQRSLFGNKPSSPRSVRSARTTGGGDGIGGGGSGSASNHHHHHHHHSHRTHSHSSQRDHVSSSATPTTTTHQQQRYRSSSVESHSSNDSRSTRRHKHRHRRTSDNESELSRGSGRSARSHHRKHRRSRHRRDSGGSDHESTRGRSYSGHRSSTARSVSAIGSHSELIDSSSQWREAQRRQQEANLGQSSVQQASVSKSSMVARSLHSNDSHSDTHSHHKSRRHKKNKSPSDSRTRIWNSELAKHLQFDLVDTAGMTEDQLREIPYTVVETTSKRSNSTARIHKSNSKNSVGGKSTGSGNTITNGSGSNSGHGKNRVDRIRGLCYQNSNPNDSNGAKNGSIRSASTISSRECDRNSGLVRMMSSMSMGDFISPTGSNLSPMENSALRVSHEHTDSGLGADQDYAYSSERSSDSTRYGTNKSSGASSGSHRKSSINGGGNSQAYNSLMQQTVSNQKHQQQQHQQQQHQQHQQHQQQHLQQQQQQQQQTRQNSFYGNRRHDNQQTTIQQPKPNYNKYSTTNQQPHPHPHQSVNTSCGASVNSHLVTPMQTSTQNLQQQQQPPHNVDKSTEKSKPSHRLLNYTTFENNQYKFSLNNAGRLATGGSNGSISARSSNGVGGGGSSLTNTHMDHFVEWPNTPAAPYYYQGPSSVAIHAKKRDAKSDLGVPTRRLSGQGITKTQLLTGGGNYPPLGSMGGYPMMSTQYPGIAYNGRLHPAKSDLFLAYPTTNEYETPFIYNYKMPNMPEFVRNPSQQSHQQQQQQLAAANLQLQQQQQQLQQQQQHQPTAYHISGAQTADPLPPNLYKSNASAGNSISNHQNTTLYGGATPATDVMYYQFDNGCVAPPTNKTQPIVQQPKSAAVAGAAVGHGNTGSPARNMGPLVFLQHQQNTANNTATTSANATMQQQQTSNITTTNTTCSNTTTTTNNITIGNDRLQTSTSTASHSRSTTCSEDDLEEIDEEPSHTEEDDDDDDGEEEPANAAYQQQCNDVDDKSEVSYDEYDDGASINNHINNNNQAAVVAATSSSTTNTTTANGHFDVTSKIIGHSSMAHRINLDNCNANNNQEQYQQQPQQQNRQQQNLISPNANTSQKCLNSHKAIAVAKHSPAPPSTTSTPLTCSTLNSNNKVITIQPLSFTATTNCNNTATNPANATAVYATTASAAHMHHQQQQLLQHNNSPMQCLEQIENLHSNSNSNSNLNSPQIHKSTTSTNNAIINFTSNHPTSTGSQYSKTQTAKPTATTTTTTTSPLLSLSTSSSLAASATSMMTTTTTTATTNAMNTIQNQLQNQNQNISSSLEIILSPIILSSRREIFEIAQQKLSLQFSHPTDYFSTGWTLSSTIVGEMSTEL